jgi:hypothetical protein
MIVYDARRFESEPDSAGNADSCIAEVLFNKSLRTKIPVNAQPG